MARKSETPVIEQPTEATDTAEAVAVAVTTRTAPLDISPTEGGLNVLGAWDGLRLLLDAQCNFEVMKNEDGSDGGIFVRDLTFRGSVPMSGGQSADVDPNFVVGSLKSRQRIELFPAYFFLNGEEPEPFESSLAMTKWLSQNLVRADGPEGKRTPQIFKSAITDYKKTHGFPPRKGRPRKMVRVEELGSLDESVLAGVNIDELAKLQDKIAALIAKGKEIHAETPAA